MGFLIVDKVIPEAFQAMCFDSNWHQLQNAIAVMSID
jgi:hypothetical protein